MFCSGRVAFSRKRDINCISRFASIQSDQGQAIVSLHGLAAETLDSMVTVAHGRAFTKSSAGLLCLRHLPFPWPLLGVASVVPRPLRDCLYDLVAKRRHRWFKRRRDLPDAVKTTEST